MASDEAPPVDPVVVEWVSKKFPDKCPSESDSDREIWMAVGAQRVVKHLRALLASQSPEEDEDPDDIE